MHSNIIEHINRYVTLNKVEQMILRSYLRYQSVKKKEFLLEAGQICKANYFVSQGCIRSYLINERGKEQVLSFGIENWWITDYISLENQLPSHFYIQAIEDGAVIAIDKNIEEELFEKIPKLERYFRLVLQKSYSAAQMRIKYAFTLSREDEFLHFKDSFPEFVQRVPQYMLASYLGFSAEFMSKIRAKKE